MPFATINGAQLFYEEAGSGEPIILHHGYTSSHDCWHGVVPRLKDRYRCIVMDCRGAGDSNGAPGPCTVTQYADDIVGMAAHLGIDTFNYVGLSMGGATGYVLALRHAARLRKMVLVAPAPADGIPLNAGARDHAVAQWRAKDREAMFRERMLTGGRPDPEYLRGAVERTLECSEGHYFEAWDSMVEMRLGAQLAEIAVPTLMVAAAADGLLPANIADFQRLGNASLHVFSRVGHGIPYEVPSALSRVIGDFLEHGVVTAKTLQAQLREALREPASAAR